MLLFERSGVKVADEFLPEHLFAQLRGYAQQLEFGPIVNPGDNTEYPDVSVEVPVWISAWVKSGLAKMMGCYVDQIKVDTQFWRLTTKATPPAPHGAHNDAIHGGYSAFYYVNEKPDDVDQAGTSLLSHKQTGLDRQPKDEGEFNLWKRDTNKYDAWNIDELIEWIPNRLAIYEADRMHRAEPPGGWGDSAQDGRLVLITFFSC
jgi:hypothetical protein